MPLRCRPTQAALPRTPRAEVVTQVLKDLEEAAAVLPVKYAAADRGRATKGAALGIKARLLPYEVPAGLSKDQMRTILRRERRIELAGEGYYYTDIRRWKTAETVMNATIYTSQNQAIVKRTFNPARDYWWPVPQTQRDLNPALTQNANY